MTNYADYFSKVTYKPQYHMGDRVRGFYQGIPFAGTVDLDTMVDQDAGPYLVVYLDLPIKTDTGVLSLIKVSHKDVFDVKGSFKLSSKTHSKRPTLGSNERTRKSR